MTDDEIKQELDDAEFSIEIDCLRDPDFIKVSSGKVYIPERTAGIKVNNDFLTRRSTYTCVKCGHRLHDGDIYCSRCGSRFV